MRRPWTFVGAALGLLLVAGACSRTGASVRGDLDALVVRSLPPGTSAPYVTVEETPQGIRASWRLQLTMPWPQYQAWVTERLAPVFVPRDANDQAMAFSRVMPADAYRVVFRRESGAVIAEFIASPF